MISGSASSKVLINLSPKTSTSAVGESIGILFMGREVLLYALALPPTAHEIKLGHEPHDTSKNIECSVKAPIRHDLLTASRFLPLTILMKTSGNELMMGRTSPRHGDI
jgi:hypothetical protein